MKQEQPLVSIIMPVKNGGIVCLETLSAVLAQNYAGDFEVLVIDSASHDGSPEAIERLFSDARSNPRGIQLHLQRIPAAEFGHGRTRNMGARLARGQYIVFLSQDATPSGSGWLTYMVGTMETTQAVGAFCRQVPRPSASLPEQFILTTAYPAASSVRTAAILNRRSESYILFSNAASIIRREALLAVPFDEQVMMCEDTRWAVQILRAGHSISYVAGVHVNHSHGFSLRTMLSRTFDYAVSLEGLPGTFSARRYLGYVAREGAFVVKHGGITEVPRMLVAEAARCLGYLLGTRYKRLPTAICARVSGYPSWFRAQSSQRRHATPLAGCEPPLAQ